MIATTFSIRGPLPEPRFCGGVLWSVPNNGRPVAVEQHIACYTRRETVGDLDAWTASQEFSSPFVWVLIMAFGVLGYVAAITAFCQTFC